MTPRKRLLRRASDHCVPLLQDALRIFADGVKLTLIARLPGDDEQDVLITTDTMEGIRGVVARSDEREECET